MTEPAAIVLAGAGKRHLTTLSADRDLGRHGSLGRTRRTETQLRAERLLAPIDFCPGRLGGAMEVTHA